jgi:hypothetical protein
VDLRYCNFKVEVKSSADCQSWHQCKPSTIKFSVRKAVVWDPASGKYHGEANRPADAYVFCHYPERDKSRANVLDVPAWDFYVAATEMLNREFGEAKSVSLSAVRRVAVRCKFDSLRATMDRALENRPLRAAR